MKTETSKLWVITREENDYNQHGEYFVAVFAKKPTKAQLMKEWCEEYANHLLKGGGRLKKEDTWFNLKRVPEGDLKGKYNYE